jgi:hypothetical protein
VWPISRLLPLDDGHVDFSKLSSSFLRIFFAAVFLVFFLCAKLCCLDLIPLMSSIRAFRSLGLESSAVAAEEVCAGDDRQRKKSFAQTIVLSE